MTVKKEPDPIPNSDVLLSDLVRIFSPTIVKILNQTPTQACGCGCCCCCNQNTTTDVATNACNVDDFSVRQELRLDPNSFGIPGGPTIIATRAVISWTVTAPLGATVTVQVRTRGLDGNPGAPFNDWSNTQFVNQSLIDEVQFNFNDFLGTKVEFRVVVLDAGGATICVGSPDS